MEKLGLSGHIKHFDVFIAGDTVAVVTKQGIEARRKVEGLGEFVKKARDSRLGWACTEDFNALILVFYLLFLRCWRIFARLRFASR